MNTEIEQFLSPFSTEVQALAWKLREVILSVMPDAVEQLDIPAKLIGYGTDRTYKGLTCGIALHKAHVNLMFAKGTSLPDPEGLLTGTGKRARHVKIQQLMEIDNPAVRVLIEAAVQHHSA